MIRAVLADTGPLYAAADGDDLHHEQAILQLQKLANDRREVAIAYPTLLETYGLLLFRMGTAAALKWLAFMGAAVLVNPTQEDYGQALTRVRGLPDQRITLVDATVAALASRMGLQVWTYDRHFDVMRVPVWR
ncbi:MAG TPA: PIN domain-containing protein [Candidatus Sulfotelmatobacter sp.]|nr:PIN domain-containing protein [Candidatus Sulfotelmatobacter sp.]